MTYSVKEIFYTLQGEGLRAGRSAVFCRFAGCNLWSGREQDRASAICRFCDTDFVGTDGEGGDPRALPQVQDVLSLRRRRVRHREPTGFGVVAAPTQEEGDGEQWNAPLQQALQTHGKAPLDSLLGQC